ncbi:hypothetical protein MmTuc01_0768 [Methanosarcina mazei Tuc01]|uniref:Uncharacterized protein n=1 Tax=Methanosarcina mazei Tuc01 TaxID=1236903 RepID=M1PVB1_METMZ|nr:hypothetical protein MmTuc01_0768 [Methanosarcina mazei Tuc01]
MSNQTVVFYSSEYTLDPFPVYNLLLPIRQNSLKKAVKPG